MFSTCDNGGSGSSALTWAFSGLCEGCLQGVSGGIC